MKTAKKREKGPYTGDFEPKTTNFDGFRFQFYRNFTDSIDRFHDTGTDSAFMESDGREFQHYGIDGIGVESMECVPESWNA